MRLVFFEVFPWPATQLLIEPEVAVVAELADPVVDAGVADVGFVAIRVAVHPRDHVAAVAAAGGVKFVLVDDAFFDEHIGDGLGVGEFARAEITVDAAEEGLVKTRRAVIVHRCDDVALRGERLYVPAVVPGVQMRGVRTAVNVLQQRVFFLFVVVGREADERLHGLAVPAFDGAALPFAEWDFFEEGVESIEAFVAVFCLLVEAIQACRMVDTGFGEDYRFAVCRLRERHDVAAVRDGSRRFGLERQLPQMLHAGVFCAEKNRAVVGAPQRVGAAVGADRARPVGGEALGLAGLVIDEHQARVFARRDAGDGADDHLFSAVRIHGRGEPHFAEIDGARLSGFEVEQRQRGRVGQTRDVPWLHPGDLFAVG